MGIHCRLLDFIMRDIVTWWVWIPFYISLAFVIIKNIESILRISLTLGALALCLVMTQLSTYFIGHPFFANIFGFVTIITLLVRSRLLAIFMSVWAILLCLGKIYFGLYTVTSLIIGGAVGIVIAFLGYWLLRYIDHRGDYYTHRRYVSRKLTSTGFLVSDINHSLFIIILTYIVIVLHSVIVA